MCILTELHPAATIDPMERILTYHIEKSDEGRSVREYLRRQGFSLHILASMKPDPDAVLLNGGHVFFTHRLVRGDILTVTIREEGSSENVIPAPVPFTVVFEDEDLMVISKPAGVSIHPAINHPADTLANGIAWYFRQKGEDHIFRCINRLDRDTTGLLLLARHRLSAAVLETQLWQRGIRRTYLAIAEGILPPEGTIDLPIGRKDGSLIERCVDAEHGDRAVTHYRTLCHFPAEAAPGADKDARLSGDSEKAGLLSAVMLRLETGRTHQIRVHMQAVGHPLLGDSLYNPDGLPGMSRQALHSWRLEFRHPITGEEMRFTDPVPADMRRVLPRDFHGILQCI